MIFDDHEVADDWNLNGRWVTRVYGREWGRFIVRNGLAAYTLMQAWGNDPPTSPGRRAGPQAARRHPGRRRAGHGAHAGDDRRPRRAARLRPADDGAAEAGALQLHRQGAGPQRRRARHAHPPRRQQPRRSRHRTWSTNLDEQLPERPSADTNELFDRRLARARLRARSVIEQLGQPLAQLIIDFKHDRHVGEIPGFAPGDLDDPQKAAGCGEPRRARRREVRPRGLVGQRARLRGPARPPRHATRRSCSCRATSTTDARSASTAGSSNGRPDAHRAVHVERRRRTSSRPRSRRSPARAGTSSGPRRCPSSGWPGTRSTSTDLVAGRSRLPLARRARLRKRPALVPERACGRTRRRIPATKPPDWSWRLARRRRHDDEAGRPAGLDLDRAVVPADAPATTIPQHLRRRRHASTRRGSTRASRCCGGSSSTRTSAPSSSPAAVTTAASSTASTRPTTVVKFNAIEEDQPLPAGPATRADRQARPAHRPPRRAAHAHRRDATDPLQGR